MMGFYLPESGTLVAFEKGPDGDDVWAIDVERMKPLYPDPLLDLRVNAPSPSSDFVAFYHNSHVYEFRRSGKWLDLSETWLLTGIQEPKDVEILYPYVLLSNGNAFELHSLEDSDSVRSPVPLPHDYLRNLDGTLISVTVSKELLTLVSFPVIDDKIKKSFSLIHGNDIRVIDVSSNGFMMSIHFVDKEFHRLAIALPDEERGHEILDMFIGTKWEDVKVSLDSMEPILYIIKSSIKDGNNVISVAKYELNYQLELKDINLVTAGKKLGKLVHASSVDNCLTLTFESDFVIICNGETKVIPYEALGVNASRKSKRVNRSLSLRL